MSDFIVGCPLPFAEQPGPFSPLTIRSGKLFCLKKERLKAIRLYDRPPRLIYDVNHGAHNGDTASTEKIQFHFGLSAINPLTFAPVQGCPSSRAFVEPAGRPDPQPQRLWVQIHRRHSF